MSRLSQGLVAEAAELAGLVIPAPDEWVGGSGPYLTCTFMDAVEALIRSVAALTPTGEEAFGLSFASSSDSVAAPPSLRYGAADAETQRVAGGLCAVGHLAVLRATLGAQLFRFCEALEEGIAGRRERERAARERERQRAAAHLNSSSQQQQTAAAEAASSLLPPPSLLRGQALYDFLFNQLVEGRVACLYAFLNADRRRIHQQQHYHDGSSSSFGVATASEAGLLDATAGAIAASVPTSRARGLVAAYAMDELRALLGTEVMGAVGVTVAATFVEDAVAEMGRRGGNGSGGAAAAGGAEGGAEDDWQSLFRQKRQHPLLRLVSSASATVFIRDNMLLPMPPLSTTGGGAASTNTAAAAADFAAGDPYAATQTQRAVPPVSSSSKASSSLPMTREAMREYLRALLPPGAAHTTAGAARRGATVASLLDDIEDRLNAASSSSQKRGGKKKKKGGKKRQRGSSSSSSSPSNSNSSSSSDSDSDSDSSNSSSSDGSGRRRGKKEANKKKGPSPPPLSAIAAAFGYEHFALLLLQLELLQRGLAEAAAMTADADADTAASTAAAEEAAEQSGAMARRRHAVLSRLLAAATSAISSSAAAPSPIASSAVSGPFALSVVCPPSTPLQLCPRTFYKSIVTASLLSRLLLRSGALPTPASGAGVAPTDLLSGGPHRAATHHHHHRSQTQLLLSSQTQTQQPLFLHSGRPTALHQIDEMSSSFYSSADEGDAEGGVRGEPYGSAAADIRTTQAPPFAVGEADGVSGSQRFTFSFNADGSQRLTLDALTAHSMAVPPVPRSANFCNRDDASDSVYTDSAAAARAAAAKQQPTAGGDNDNGIAANAKRNALGSRANSAAAAGIGSDDDEDGSPVVLRGSQRGSDNGENNNSNSPNGFDVAANGKAAGGRSDATSETTATTNPHSPLRTRRDRRRANNGGSSAPTVTTATTTNAASSASSHFFTRRRRRMQTGRSLSHSQQRVRSVRSYASKFRHSDGRSGTTMEEYNDESAITLAVPEVCRAAMDSGVQAAIEHVPIPRAVLVAEMRWQLREARAAMLMASSSAPPSDGPSSPSSPSEWVKKAMASNEWYAAIAAALGADAAAAVKQGDLGIDLEDDDDDEANNEEEDEAYGGDGAANPFKAYRRVTGYLTAARRASPLRRLLLTHYRRTLPFSLDAALDELGGHEEELAAFVRTARRVLEAKTAALRAALQAETDAAVAAAGGGLLFGAIGSSAALGNRRMVDDADNEGRLRFPSPRAEGAIAARDDSSSPLLHRKRSGGAIGGDDDTDDADGGNGDQQQHPMTALLLGAAGRAQQQRFSRMLAALESEMLSEICDAAARYGRVCAADARWDLCTGDAARVAEAARQSPQLMRMAAAHATPLHPTAAAAIDSTTTASSPALMSGASSPSCGGVGNGQQTPLQALRTALAAFNNSCQHAISTAREAAEEGGGRDGRVSEGDEEAKARRNAAIVETDPHVTANLRYILSLLLGPCFFDLSATPAVVNTAAAVQTLTKEALLLLSTSVPTEQQNAANKTTTTASGVVGGGGNSGGGAGGTVTLSFAVVSCVACESALSVPICLPNDPINRHHATMPLVLQQHILHHAASARHRRRARLMGVDAVLRALAVPQHYAPFYGRVNADGGRLVAGKLGLGGTAGEDGTDDASAAAGAHTIVHINGLSTLLPVRPPQGGGAMASAGETSGAAAAATFMALSGGGASAVASASAPFSAHAEGLAAIASAVDGAVSAATSGGSPSSAAAARHHPLAAALGEAALSWCGVAPPEAALLTLASSCAAATNNANGDGSNSSFSASPDPLLLLTGRFQWQRIVSPHHSSSSSPSSTMLARQEAARHPMLAAPSLVLASDVAVNASTVKLVGLFARLRQAGQIAGQLQRHAWGSAALTEAILEGTSLGSEAAARQRQREREAQRRRQRRAAREEAGASHPQSATQILNTESSQWGGFGIGSAPSSQRPSSGVGAGVGAGGGGLSLEESYFRSMMGLPTSPLSGASMGAADFASADGGASHFSAGSGGANAAGAGGGGGDEEDFAARRLPTAAWSPLSALVSLTVNTFASASFANGEAIVLWLLACFDTNAAAEIGRIAAAREALAPKLLASDTHSAAASLIVSDSADGAATSMVAKGTKGRKKKAAAEASALSDASSFISSIPLRPSDFAASRKFLNSYANALFTFGAIATAHPDRLLAAATTAVEGLRTAMARLRPAARDTYRQRVVVQMKRLPSSSSSSSASTKEGAAKTNANSNDGPADDGGLFDCVTFVTLAGYQDLTGGEAGGGAGVGADADRLVGDSNSEESDDVDDADSEQKKDAAAAEEARREAQRRRLYRHSAALRYRHGAACLSHVVEVLSTIVREASAFWEGAKERLGALIYQLQLRQCAEVGLLPDVASSNSSSGKSSNATVPAVDPSPAFLLRVQCEKQRLLSDIASLLLSSVALVSSTADGLGTFFRCNSAEVFAKPINVAIPAECTLGKWSAKGAREPAPTVFRLALAPAPPSQAEAEAARAARKRRRAEEQEEEADDHDEDNDDDYDETDGARSAAPLGASSDAESEAY